MAALDAPCPWYVAGSLIGAVLVALRWLANKPLGALGGYIETAEWLARRSPVLGWRAFFLLGVVLGGGLFGLLAGGRAAGFGYGSFDLLFSPSLTVKGVVLASAGALMGYSARLGGGCTSGHGLCGVALGSRASAVATAVFFEAAVATAHLLAFALGGRP